MFSFNFSKHWFLVWFFVHFAVLSSEMLQPNPSDSAQRDALISPSVSILNVEFPEAAPYITTDFKVTDIIVKILGLTGIRVKNDPIIPEENWPDAQLTISSRDITEVMEAIQAKKDPKITWLRTQNQERWHMQKLSYLPCPLPAEAILEALLQGLNASEDIRPRQSYYNGILILGSSLPIVFAQANYLKSLKLDSTIPLTLLAGDRILESNFKESYEQWMKLTDNQGTIEGGTKNFPTDEKGMMELVMNYFQFPYQTCYAQKIPNAQRATTFDTVKEWLKLAPQPGNYLVMSSQPFTTYQALVFKRTLLQILKEKAAVYTIETVGHRLNSTLEAGHSDFEVHMKALIGLDNLARILFELHTLKVHRPT